MFQPTQLNLGDPLLPGDLRTVTDARGVVLFAHADGGARTSRRSVHTAQRLHAQQLSTLLFELLTPEEGAQLDKVEDVDLLTNRLLQAMDALPQAMRRLPVGLFGSDTGAAAALMAAVHRPQRVSAVVLRSGRADLADEVLSDIRAPTLLIVGAADKQLLQINREAFGRLRCEKRIDVISRATRLFLEAGTLDAASQRAGEWFGAHLRGS
jgi:putative phosphoribosyl transferase